MPMWNSFWHLMWRSLEYFPKTLSGNWLSVLLPVLIWTIREGFRVRQSGWRAINWSEIGRDTWLMTVAYVALFGWAVVHTVYQDHVTFIAENSRLKKQLFFREAHGLSLKIGGIIYAADDTGAIYARLTVTASNDGEPTMAHKWEMQFHLSSKVISSVHSVVIPSDLQNERLDVRLEQPLMTSGETTGVIAFLLPHQDRSVIEEIMADPSARVVLSTLDNNDRRITTERSIAELKAERMQRYREKR